MPEVKFLARTAILPVLIFTISMGYSSPGNNRATITISDSASSKPLADAYVHIIPLASADQKGKEISGFTDQKGIYVYDFTAPALIRISNFGYGTITDTLRSAENKNYHLAYSAQNIKDVVVTGQYGENKADKSIYEVKVISGEMLRAKGANNLYDALQNELSIDFGQDQVFGSYLGINGISGEGVKVMVDGVPIVGREDGKLDLSEIDINNIDHIEIVEGPLSVMYGTDAMGGVINIITKTYQKEKININLKAYYESVGQYNIEANAGFAFKKNKIFISGGRNFFGGYSAIDSPRFKQWLPREQYFADARYLFRDRGFSLALSGSFFRELMLDRSTPEQTLAPPADTSWTYIGNDTHYLTYRERGSAYFTYRFKEDQHLEVLLAYSGFQRYIAQYIKDLVTLQQQLSADPGSRDTTYFSQYTARATYNMSAWKERLNMQFGLDINQEYTRENIISNGKQQEGDYAAFGGVKVTIVEGLDIQPAIRFSYNTRFDVPLIPSLNIKYNYKDKLLLRASWGRGYRAPSLEESYLYFFDPNHALKGNPALQAEDGQTVNASASYTQKIHNHTVVYSVSGFYNNIKNMIDWEIVGINPVSNIDTYQYFNLARYITYGGDASVTYRWKGLHMGVSGQLTWYDLPGVIGQPTAMHFWSPDIMLNAGYRIPKALITVNISDKYNGKKPIFSVNSSETGTRAAYSMLNASLSRDFWKDRIQLTLGAKNILNVRDVLATNVVGVGHNIGGDDMSIGWGTTFFVTLILHYGG